MRKLFLLVAAVVLAVATTASADPKQHRFAGHHPHAKNRGYCYIEFPHVHTYRPARKRVMYRDHGEWSHFVGDPRAHGYEGDTHAYHGAHPIFVEHAIASVEVEAEPHVEWCYIRGPHSHAYAAPGDAEFEVKGDVYWYVGAYPPEFEADMKIYAPINKVYARVEYERPTVVVEPPTAYVDVFVPVRAAASVEAGAAVTGGAALEVHVPVPVVEVSVGGHSHVEHRKYKHRKHKRKHRKHRGRVRWR